MIDKLYIKKIKYNDNININLKSKTFKNIQKHIRILKKKYNKELIDFYNYKEINFVKYDYNLIIKNNMQYKQAVINVIKDVINLYRKKIKNLDCVFLAGSYARGTNKISSDIDLHFFYKRKPKNFLYEEIVNYIVASVLNKPRDSLDPTFILNFNNTKQKISKKMNNDALNITLISNDEKISYSYMQGKKRRFYLQYLNSRKLSVLKKYILNQIKENNKEFNHCFEIIYGRKHFNKMYRQIYNEELKLIDLKYILMKIDSLILKISHSYFMKEKNISFAKRLYQSVNFDLIYGYYSILRITLIYKKRKVFFLI